MKAWTPGQNSVPQVTPVTPPKGDIQLLLHQQQEAIKALTLTQPEVPVFSGDPIGYCEFIWAFKNLVEQKNINSSTSRLYYLLQYTSGSVQDLARSCSTMPNKICYNAAKRLLAVQNGQMLFLTNEHAKKAEITILLAQETTQPGLQASTSWVERKRYSRGSVPCASHLGLRINPV